MTTMKRESNLEAQFAYLLRTIGKDLPHPEREYVFASPRRWRFDFAFPEDRVAVEIEGGTFASGRHTRPMGFENDCAKYNEAAVLGWRVLRFTSRMLRERPDRCIETLRRLVGLPFADADPLLVRAHSIVGQDADTGKIVFTVRG